MKFVLIDLADAFCHFGVNPKEYRHCVAPDEKATECSSSWRCCSGFGRRHY